MEFLLIFQCAFINLAIKRQSSSFISSRLLVFTFHSSTDVMSTRWCSIKIHYPPSDKTFDGSLMKFAPLICNFSPPATSWKANFSPPRFRYRNDLHLEVELSWARGLFINFKSFHKLIRQKGRQHAKLKSNCMGTVRRLNVSNIFFVRGRWNGQRRFPSLSFLS